MPSLQKLMLMFFLIIASQTALTNNANQTQTYFNQWAQQNKIVGAALAINNKSYVYGSSDLLHAQPVTAETEFGIGSVTKTLITFILLKLEERELLNIHDVVTVYLPQYDKLKKVTIQQLMQMTAGFNDVYTTNNYVTPLENVTMAYTRFAPPKTKTLQYSNVSYQLLGLVIEKVTKQPLPVVLSRLITLPMNLPSIHFPTRSQADFLKEYQNGKVRISSYDNPDAAGGLVSNAKDLEDFIHHLFVAKDILAMKQNYELNSFIDTSSQYYAFTGTKAPKFGLGVFKWNLSPQTDVLTYPGVLKEGFSTTYTVVGSNVIISQTNTYNQNDFTILWPHREFTLGLIKIIRSLGG
jgi:CubicO group peptidase (beta-lactamase class C family)